MLTCIIKNAVEKVMRSSYDGDIRKVNKKQGTYRIVIIQRYFYGRKKIGRLKRLFDEIIHISEDGEIEYWYTRELQPLLGYSRWEKFELVVKKTMISCENSGRNIKDHFRGVTKMIKLDKNAERGIKEYALTRYACYLIAQNGDSRKDEIAFAQSHFPVQTRKQELSKIYSNDWIFLGIV